MCVYVSLSEVPLATPLFPSVPPLVVCVIFKLCLKASSSATYCDVLPVILDILSVVLLMLLFGTRRCEAVQLLNVPPPSPSV